MTEPLDVVKLFVIFIVSGVVLGAVSNALWSVPDQMVQDSGNGHLQTTYQTGKGMINVAEEGEDNFAFAKSVLTLAGIIGIPACIIKIIRDL